MRHFLFAAAMFGVACGGGSVSLSDFLTKSVDAQCHLQFHCCSTTEIDEIFMGETVNNQPVTTESQCDQLEGGFVILAVGIVQQSIDKGRLVYDGDAAQSCIDSIQNAACADLAANGAGGVGSSAACGDVLVPQVAAGGACTQDAECTTTNCIGASTGSDGTQTDGACQALPGTGSACDLNCVAGDFCGFDGSGESCQPKAAVGSACDEGDQCQSEECEDDGSGSMICVELCQGS